MRSVVIIALNSFEHLFGGSEHQFNLALAAGRMASLANLERVLNRSRSRLEDPFRSENPLAGYYLESFLRARGYETRTLFRWTGPRQLELAMRTDPAAVLFSTTYITDNNMLSTCLRNIKTIIGNVPLIVGGPYIWKHAIEWRNAPTSTCLPANPSEYESEQFNDVQRSGADIVSDNLFCKPNHGPLRGPIYIASEFGEHTLLRVLQRLDHRAPEAKDLCSIPNLILPIDDGWHDTGIENEPIDLNATYTRWDLVDEMPSMVPMRASVGCPYKCRFCDFITLHPKVIMRSAASLSAEIELAKSRGASVFHFVDDNIFLSKKRIGELSEAIRKLAITWGGFFRVDRIDKTNVDGLLASGCRFGLCGVESADDRMIKLMRKGCDMSEIREGIELSSAAGISLTLTFIVGFPGENEQSIANTVSFVNGLTSTNKGVLSYQLYPFYLLPSTAADHPDFRRQHGVRGRFASWSHDSMSYDDVVERWAPEMFRQIKSLPYHYYSHDSPLYWSVDKRNRAFDIRRRLTVDFLDTAPDSSIQGDFAALCQVVRPSLSEKEVPAWQSILAPRQNQPGARVPLQRLGG
jgi:hypothetical protein